MNAIEMLERSRFRGPAMNIRINGMVTRIKRHCAVTLLCPCVKKRSEAMIMDQMATRNQNGSESSIDDRAPITSRAMIMIETGASAHPVLSEKVIISLRITRYLRFGKTFISITDTGGSEIIHLPSFRKHFQRKGPPSGGFNDCRKMPDSLQNNEPHALHIPSIMAVGSMGDERIAKGTFVLQFR